MNRIIVCTLAVLSALAVFGQVPSDSVKVYFKVGQWNFDRSFGDNAASMDDFIDRVRVAFDAHNLDHIVVRSYTSPDGTDRFNKRLAKNRCEEVVSLITDSVGVPRDLIVAEPKGVAWAELRRLVDVTPDVPSRQKILDILDNTPIYVFDSNRRVVDGRKKQLMDLRGGRPYNWMLEHLFPELRNAVAVALYLKGQPEPQVEVVEVETVGTAVAESDVEMADTVTVVTQPVITDEPAPLQEVDDTDTPHYILALKTNMLYDAALLPNLELEWLIKDVWSVAISGNLAQWGNYDHEKSYRLALIDVEARRWIRPRAPWHGFYVGVLAGGGWYDLENGSPGHYGDGFMTGLTVGFMWPIGKRLSLEAELGGGYMYIHDKEYTPFEGHHVYQRTKDINYFGPIKLKFSIAWRFFDVKTPKTPKSTL